MTVVHVGEGSDEQFCGYDSWTRYLKAYGQFWSPYNRYAPLQLRRIIGTIAQALASNTRGRSAQVAEALFRAGCGRELFWSGANSFWNIHKNRVFNPIESAGPWEELSKMGLDITGLPDTDSGAVVDGYFKKFNQDHPGKDFLTRMIYAEFRQRLPELLLMRVDKITMSTSVEGRVPFLDHHLVDYSMDIPQEKKVGGGVNKAILKTAVKGLIPDEIINRPKMGFAAPVAEWLRGDFGREVERDLLSSPLVTAGILNRASVANLVSQHRSGRADHALHIWTLFNLTAWNNHWIN